MVALGKRTIGQIVAADFRNSAVFKKFNIDYCCNGNMSISEVCKKHGIKPGKLLAELKGIGHEGAADEIYNNWSLESLVDYIIDDCHGKAREKLSEIKFYAEKVTEIHGQDHEELFDIYQEFLILRNVMMAHMQDEDEQLFPEIKELAGKPGNAEESDEANSACIIEAMQNDHKEIGTSIKTIRRISNDYALLGDASTIYQALFGNLAILEKDLRKCVHLENNILFPKALNFIQSA